MIKALLRPLIHAYFRRTRRKLNEQADAEMVAQQTATLEDKLPAVTHDDRTRNFERVTLDGSANEIDSKLTSSGMLTVNTDTIKQEEVFTTIVLGIPRGGTTMAARVLDALGIYMGKMITANYEDPDLVFHQLNYNQDKSDAHINAMREMVEARSNEHPIWGWKIPGAPLPSLYDACHNPRFISIHRDEIAIASRIDASDDEPFMGVLTGIMEVKQKIQHFLMTSGRPIYMISYEKALLHPEKFVDGLIQFLAPYHPTAAQRQAAIDVITPSPKEYLLGTRTPEVEGNLDGMHKGCIMGWVMDNRNLDRELDITIFIDGKEYTTERADHYRPDVKKLKGGTGRYGFLVAISDTLKDGTTHTVEATVKGEEDVLIGSIPQTLQFPGVSAA